MYQNVVLLTILAAVIILYSNCIAVLITLLQLLRVPDHIHYNSTGGAKSILLLQYILSISFRVCGSEQDFVTANSVLFESIMIDETLAG